MSLPDQFGVGPKRCDPRTDEIGDVGRRSSVVARCARVVVSASASL
jgi:hypothetical protein